LPRGQRCAIDVTSGRERLNLHGAIDLETGQTRIKEVQTVDAQSSIDLFASLERAYSTMSRIHAFLYNARYQALSEKNLYCLLAHQGGLELHCFCSRINNALRPIRRRKSPILICLDNAAGIVAGTATRQRLEPGARFHADSGCAIVSANVQPLQRHQGPIGHPGPAVRPWVTPARIGPGE